jgi:hypothetical protein
MKHNEVERLRFARLIADRAVDSMSLDDGGAPKDIQLKFRATSNLRDMLDEAAKSKGRNGSEEIRRRLEKSFLDDIAIPDDEATARLIRAIRYVVHNVEPPFGSWYENRFAFETFRAAVLALIDLHRPTGAAARPEDNEIADMYLGEEGTPETAGRMLAGSAAVAVNIPMPSRSTRREG